MHVYTQGTRPCKSVQIVLSMHLRYNKVGYFRYRPQDKFGKLYIISEHFTHKNIVDRTQTFKLFQAVLPNLFGSFI